MDDPSFHGRGIFSHFSRYDWGMLAFVFGLMAVLVTMEVSRIVSNSGRATRGENVRNVSVGSTEGHPAASIDLQAIR